MLYSVRWCTVKYIHTITPPPPPLITWVITSPFEFWHWIVRYSDRHFYQYLILNRNLLNCQTLLQNHKIPLIMTQSLTHSPCWLNKSLMLNNQSKTQFWCHISNQFLHNSSSFIPWPIQYFNLSQIPFHSCITSNQNLEQLLFIYFFLFTNSLPSNSLSGK